jgi:hypothetical protein
MPDRFRDPLSLGRDALTTSAKYVSTAQSLFAGFAPRPTLARYFRSAEKTTRGSALSDSQPTCSSGRYATTVTPGSSLSCRLHALRFRRSTPVVWFFYFLLWGASENAKAPHTKKIVGGGGLSD